MGKCRYSTCCAKTMSGHVQLFHSGSKTFDLGKSSIMREPMYCVCGYSAHSGNKLAKHLGTHGCKSAYPSIQEANKARVDVDGSESYKGDVCTNEDKNGEEMSENMDTEYEKETKEDEIKSNDVSDNENSEVDTKKDEEGKTNDDKGENSDVKDPEDDDKGEKSDDKDTEEINEESKDNKNDEADTKGEEENDEEETSNEDDKQPAPGGILFGTFFNNMDKNKDGNGDKKNESIKENGSESNGVNDEADRSTENMETE